MKRWSQARLAILLWFGFYAVFAFAGYFSADHPSIFGLIVRSTLAMFLGLLFVGFLQEA